ncbi:MucR family transcriptional regulator [Aquamicrobium zhengzhouense]|uniref:MucR family transcriptional regulator n=1 Tax=Aquamicrobium zhengzhouense TaxID=2781738 RepID=A0ABS0SC27_9HYPH|nr:MucR family transcriptional regulator [Aquamicrobium zhengzhouense]MBI1620185.1 MucR family transcriptional regulator [Aquamicrobium zhengzhouense]
MGSEKDREEESLSMILTAEIVSAYVSANTIPHDSIGKFILNVRSALTQSNNSVQEIDCALQEPAVSPKKSVHQDFLICLEDGKKFKSLKRHLMTHHGMTPEEYRTKWNLPIDYPMVAPTYSERRTQLALEHGLGHTPKSRSKDSPKKRKA